MIFRGRNSKEYEKRLSFFFFLKCEILFIVCLYSMRSNPIQSNTISLFDFIYFFFVVSFFVRKMERINKNNQAKKKEKK